MIFYELLEKDEEKCSLTHLCRYRCVSPGAVTSELGLASSVCGRLSRGDLFVVEEGPESCGELQRLRGQVHGSSVRGWVTVRGNAGTAARHMARLQIYKISSDTLST